eukprot:6047023-Prymnesium_polylepis.2
MPHTNVKFDALRLRVALLVHRECGRHSVDNRCVQLRFLVLLLAHKPTAAQLLSQLYRKAIENERAIAASTSSGKPAAAALHTPL